MFRLRINAAASPADQQLHVRATGQPLLVCFVPVVLTHVCVLRDISGTKCDFSVQVQLRFCLSETSCPQEDHFPPNLCVKVNGKPCNLPVRVAAPRRSPSRPLPHSLLSPVQGYLPPTKNGVEPKRPSRPINITSLVRLSTTVPNTIVVSWTAEIGRVSGRTCVVCVVREALTDAVPTELLAGRVPGEAAVVHDAATEATGEGHQEPGPLQSSE